MHVCTMANTINVMIFLYNTTGARDYYLKILGYNQSIYVTGDLWRCTITMKVYYDTFKGLHGRYAFITNVLIPYFKLSYNSGIKVYALSFLAM